jgi:FAD/FMN-containing dehydrogenase
MTAILDSLAELRHALSPSQVLLPSDGLDRYQRSALDGFAGRAAAVVRPRTTDEVRVVMRWAYRHRIRVVAQGANTGLVRGGLPDETGATVVLSLELCRQRLELDVVNRTVTASAGHDLGRLNEELAGHGLLLPVDVGSNPSVGGMVSTNTGGAKVLGFGDVRRRVLGLEVVLPDSDATVLNMLSGLRKDNSGLDAKQLFIGTGGVFGVEVTARPRQVATAWAAVRDDESAFALLQQLEESVGDFLTSYELTTRNVLEIRARHNPGLRLPFPDGRVPELAVLVELSTTLSSRAGLSVEDLLVDALDRAAGLGQVLDAVVGPHDDMWAIRHGGDEFGREGVSYWVDVSVPRSRLAEFRRRFFGLVEERFAGWVPLALGHYGDGGVHAGVLYPHRRGSCDPAEVESLRDELYDVVADLGGSFSAEHGIGPYNQRFYHRHKDPALQALSGLLKSVVDRRSILGVADFGPSGQG